MRRISWLAAAALVVVGVGAVVLVVLDPGAGKASTTQYITTAARQTNVVKSAVATGTVQATQTYALAFGSDPQIVTSASSGSGSSGSGSSGSGGSTITWLVKSVSASVGQKVTKGEVLASADPGDAQAQLAAAQAQLAAAQAKLTADQAGATTTQKQTASGQVTSAQNQLANARTSLANTQAQNALSLSQSQAAVTRAQAQLDTDTANSAPQNVLTQDQNALQQARDSLASTQLKVQASNTQAAQQVTSAQLALSQAQASYTAAIAPAATAQIASDQAGVASAQASVTSAQARVDAATLHAPVDGVVSAVTIQPGFDAPSGAAIDVQSSGMQIVAAFTETDLPSLAVGQAADVAINATGQQTTGKVASITPTAATAGSGTSVVTYNVDVSLDEVPPGTSAGMTAQVSVTTASVAGAIAVPPIAISGTSGNYSVQVLDSSGQVHAQSVQVGLIGSDLAQITSGLNAGDRVVIGSSSQRQGTTTTGFGGLGGGNVRGLTGGGGGFGGGNFGGNGGNRGTTP